MTLVDSTVWIDFFRDRDNPQVRELERLVNAGEDVCVCGAGASRYATPWTA